MRSIYVFGLFPISPGKTVVSSALCRGLLSRGFKVAPFKPRSGHDLWYQYEAFKKCKKNARLFCEDITKLKEASRCQLPYEILNPIDALMAPINARTFLENGYVREMYLKKENTFLHLIVERYTSWKEDRTRTLYCLNKKSFCDETLSYKDYVRDLTSKPDEIITIEDASGWASVLRRFGPVCTSTCSRRIAEEYEMMVVEGFNDAVCPAPELRYDVVVCVAPGVAALYDPNDFHRVIEVRSTIGGEPMGMRAKDIVDFIKPEKIFKVPTLDIDDLGDFDRLSKKLGYITEAVLDRFPH